jgi:hypothetical protein
VAAQSPAPVIFFKVAGDPGLHFAVRRGRDYWACNRYRGWKLCGVRNRRAGAALVAGDRSIRVALIEQPVEAVA